MRVRDHINRLLTQSGYQLEKKPRELILNPSHEITGHFDYLVSHLALNTPDFFFLQIGANDGVMADPLRRFVVQHRWRGVLVEPQREIFERLQHTYADHDQLILKNVALSQADGYRNLYKVRMDGHVDAAQSGLARFDRDSLLKKLGGSSDSKALIETENVRCLTLQSLIAETEIEKIDLLAIDAEGFDFEIIKMIDFDEMPPTMIRYEHAHLDHHKKRDCLRLLISKGYRLLVERNDTTAYLLREATQVVQ